MSFLGLFPGEGDFTCLFVFALGLDISFSVTPVRPKIIVASNGFPATRLQGRTLLSSIRVTGRRPSGNYTPKKKCFLSSYAIVSLPGPAAASMGRCGSGHPQKEEAD